VPEIRQFESSRYKLRRPSVRRNHLPTNELRDLDAANVELALRLLTSHRSFSCLLFAKRGDEVTPKEVLALCREKDVKRWTCGLWIFRDCGNTHDPVTKLDEDVFEDGVGFDGSSIRGCRAFTRATCWWCRNRRRRFWIPSRSSDASDGLQHPGPDYARITRATAKRGPQGGQSSQEHRIADTAYVGPEAEFFIFDDIRFDQNATNPITISTASRVSGIAAASKIPTWLQTALQRGYFPYHRDN